MFLLWAGPCIWFKPKQRPLASSLTSPKASWLPWAGLTLAPCTAIFLMLSFGTLPPVPPGCAATMNSLVQPLGTTPSPVRTLPTGRPRRGTYSMLWGSWRIPRWHCGFCVAVLDSLACCIACGATRPPRKLWLWTCLTAWSADALATLQGSTLRRSSGNRHPWALRTLDLACAPRPTMPQRPIWLHGRQRCARPVTLMQVSAWKRARQALLLLRLWQPSTPRLAPPGPSPLTPPLPANNRTLSHTLDAAGWEEQLANASLTGRATLLSEASVGGRAFLSAVPYGRTQMEPAVFVTEVRACLRVADADNDAWCPLCDAVLDCHSYHAEMCAAGGERTQRHPRCSGLGLRLVQAWGPAPRAGATRLALADYSRGRDQQYFWASPCRCLPARLRRDSYCLWFRHHGAAAAGRRGCRKPMPATKNFIFRRLQLVRLRGWNSFQWLLSVAALGMPGPWRFCTMWHVRLPPALAKIRPHAPASCSNSSVSPFGRTGLERRCGAAVLCFKQPGQHCCAAVPLLQATTWCSAVGPKLVAQGSNRIEAMSARTAQNQHLNLFGPSELCRLAGRAA